MPVPQRKGPRGGGNQRKEENKGGEDKGGKFGKGEKTLHVFLREACITVKEELVERKNKGEKKPKHLRRENGRRTGEGGARHKEE